MPRLVEIGGGVGAGHSRVCCCFHRFCGIAPPAGQAALATAIGPPITRRRRYFPGLIPVARRKALVKLACDEKRASKAIFASDDLPTAISAIARSSRMRPM